jgi:hypothetical protein
VATISIAVRTEPHVAELGDVEVLFQPEVDGSDLLEQYAILRERQKELGVDVDAADITPEDVEAAKKARQALADFVMWPMLPESRETFASRTWPDRVLVQLMHWLMGEEVYGAGRPTGSPTGSAPPSSKPGRRSTASGRSKGSTRAGGRPPAS